MADRTAGPGGAEASSQRWIDNSDGSYSAQLIAAGRYTATKPTLTDGLTGPLQLGTRGSLAVELHSVDGTANADVRASADAITASVQSLGANAFTYGYNGASWDRLRTPNIFKALSAVVITSETTIWTPAAGKKFRLMGLLLTQGVVTGAVTIKDNTSGTTIAIIPPHTIAVAMPLILFGNGGILSAAANNVLTATGASTETITGTIFGTEE